MVKNLPEEWVKSPDVLSKNHSFISEKGICLTECDSLWDFLLNQVKNCSSVKNAPCVVKAECKSFFCMEKNDIGARYYFLRKLR